LRGSELSDFLRIVATLKNEFVRIRTASLEAVGGMSPW